MPRVPLVGGGGGGGGAAPVNRFVFDICYPTDIFKSLVRHLPIFFSI